MKIKEFRCKGYKAFRDETQIQVRPLTLFFGKNNSGKSALLRLPRLLLRALSSRARNGFPLNVDDLSFGETFRDLTHGGLAHGSASFGIVIEDEGDRLELDATVQNVQNMPASSDQPKEFNVVSNLHIVNPPINLEWEPRAQIIASYRGIGEVPFRGLLPDMRGRHLDTSMWHFVEPWRERAATFEDHISHLGPIRGDIPRVFEGGASLSLGFEGAGAVSWLGQDRNLLEQTSSWFQKYLDGWGISLDYAGSVYRCLLKRGGISVNLADVGHGIQQVLPVVVQQLAHQTNSAVTVLDLVEQPELHLHAAAHAPLGDLFLETARRGQCQVLVETHSENLLLRIRRRIAEGFDPSLIALYFVLEQPDGYSTVKPIEILPDGSVAWWPEGVFTEGYEELKALNRARHSEQLSTSL